MMCMITNCIQKCLFMSIRIMKWNPLKNQPKNAKIRKKY